MALSERRYRRCAWFPVVAVFLCMVAFISIKSGRDAVFFEQDGLERLPLAYLAIALSSLPMGMLHIWSIRRWGARRVRIGVFLLAGFMFLAFSPVIHSNHPLAVLVMFAVTPVVFAAVFAGAWLLAGDLLENAPRNIVGRTYARIGAGSMLGGILGGLLARELADWLSAGHLIAFGSSFLFLVALLVAEAHRRYAALPALCPSREDETDSVTPPRPQQVDVFREPYILGLLGVSSLAAVAALLIDFQFYAVVTAAGETTVGFFGSFYAVINALSLFLQLVVAPRLQSRFGVGRVLMILPASILGGLGWAVTSASFFSQSVLKLTESGVKASLYRSVWEQVFLPIGRRQRETVKMLVDGLSARLAEGLAAAVLYVYLWGLAQEGRGVQLSWIFWAIALLLLSWLGLTYYLNRRGCADIVASEITLRLPDS